MAFNDIGKSTRDLLNKDYPIEGAKVEVKTNTSDGKVRNKHTFNLILD